MKRFAFVFCLLFIASTAFASFSGHYFCYQFGGKTHQNRLYTSTSDVGAHYMGVRLGGVPLYMMLDSTSRADASHFRAKIASGTYAGIPNAHVYYTKWGTEGTGNDNYKYPMGMIVNSNGVYVCDYGNVRIKQTNVSGTFVRAWGSYGTGDGQFGAGPRDIACDSSGNLYVTDQANHRVQKFTSTGTFSAKWGSSGSGNGQFNDPCGIAVDASGNIYVVDRDNYRVQKFNSAGTYLTQWGSSGTGNGQFQNPVDVTVDKDGYVWVSDMLRGDVQKFNSTGTYQTKITVSALAKGVTSDSSGYIYIADATNDRIWKYTSAGTLVTYWGSSGTGSGQLSYPQDVCAYLDDIYTTEQTNCRVQVFK